MSAILADIGLPMVALYLPFAWFALVPIIFIEAAYGARRFNLPFRRALLAQATGNCLSTVIGIPATWLALVLLQSVTTPSGTGPAWLLPDPSWWTIATAIAVLTVVFYLMSVVSEGFVVARFFSELPRKTIRRWMLQANGITYTLLLVLVLGADLMPKVAGSVFQVMQPVSEGIVDLAFRMENLAFGRREEQPPKLENFAKRYADAWCSHDPEKVAAFYARNGSISVNGAAPVPIAEVARGFVRDFPDMVVTFDKLEDTSAGTEFHWTFTGTNTGPRGTGNRVRISGYELWKIDSDGLIGESKGNFDAAEYERQLKHGLAERNQNEEK